MTNQYYTYLYFDPKDGTPIYVGKGIGRRAYKHKLNKLKIGCVIRKRIKEGYIDVKIVMDIQ